MHLQELHTRTELESLQQLMHMHYSNYRLSKESIALVDQKYHDLKHQIDILRTETPQDRQKYLDLLEQEIKTYEAQNKTGNRILDTILTAKTLQCQNRGISLTCVADGSALDFMNTMDLSALFGNALDNAIEGACKIADPEKRLIHVSVARQKQFLRIRIENCYEGELLYENGVFLTTKADKLHHGFGLKSMQETVEKYNGSMTVEAREGWFELRILLPLPAAQV
jgi:sensor histidine kinase regulating citrate/malate metabolism